MEVATESVDIEPSKQLTTVPFRALLTGLITILDISGKLPGPESLEAVNVELLIITSRGMPLGPMDVRTATIAGVIV